MSYQKEFPDFILDVEIPPDFEDRSWHNDMCPAFYSKTRKILLWVDYADRSKAELPETERFAVQRLTGDSDVYEPDYGNVTLLLSTNDWSDVKALLDLDFSTKIETIEAAKAWIENLHKAGMMFHFEDDPETIICGADDDRPLFTSEQAAQVRERIAELYSFDWEALECPIGYALTIMEK